MPSLVNDIRQLFSEAVLKKYDRLKETNVSFTFDRGEIYLSSFAEAFNLIDQDEFKDFDQEILAYAKVFENFISNKTEIINPFTAGLISASLYWISGYSANSYVIARIIRENFEVKNPTTALLLKILGKRNLNLVEFDGELEESLSQYIKFGDKEKIEQAIIQAQRLVDQYLRSGYVDDYISSYLLTKILKRLHLISFWYWVQNNSKASTASWRKYVEYSIENQSPVIDLWPSQRIAIEKGLLDGKSSIIIRMPTSSGKTKMSELAFINDLNINKYRRCLYLAPFRALVSEVENTIGLSLSNIGFPVASLYGGSEANEIELELTKIARVIIATPEKIAAVLRLTGGSLKDFGTIILDEGHLLDSNERGTTYELQLATLQPQLAESNRVIFLSAVLPNSSELATWLKGSQDALAEDDWQPTTMRMGVVTWPKGGQARLDYKIQTGQSLMDNFFVPNLFEEEIWQEENVLTQKMNTHSFPKRGENGSIAAVLAFQAARSGPVIVYTSRPDWANSIAKRILERISLHKPITTNLVDESNKEQLQQFADYLQATLGNQSILPQIISHGFSLHHGGIPQRIRLIIEEEFRNQTIRLLIATNTIAQGVNFPARTVIVHSLPVSESPIRDFWNLIGRAGRAMKETEGEVIVLATGNLKTRRLNDFLNQGNSERAESRILYFVKELLQNYPLVSYDTIAALLQDHDYAPKLGKIVRSIDTYLLEVIAEDAIFEGADPYFDEFINSLLATHQSKIEGDWFGMDLTEGVKNLMFARRNHVIAKVPNGNTRKRYAKTGLSIESSISLDELLPEMQQFFEKYPNFSQDAFLGVIEFINGATELEHQNHQQIALLGYQWLQTGRYDDIFKIGQSTFQDFDEAVQFTEEVLCFLTPWVLSGFVRLVTEIENCPVWFRLLPDYLRYGVNKQTLVWIMSLGFIDRRFSEWLLSIYHDENRIDPPSFRNLVQWILANKLELTKQIDNAWPRFFSQQFNKVISRYQRIYEVLGKQ